MGRRSRRGTAEFQLGDRVRLTDDGPDGPSWSIVAFSYAEETFDLMACNPRAPEQFRKAVSLDQLALVEPQSDEPQA